MNLFLSACLLIWILVTILWIWSIFIKNVSIIDIFWGMSFVIVNLFYAFMSGDFNLRKILVLILVTIWGVRLSIYLGIRNIGKGEDFRYQTFRKNYGIKRYWWYSYFQAFLLQGFLIMIISLPLLAINLNINPEKLNALDYCGIFVWLVGFVFEAGGDYQLWLFKKKKENKDKILNTGFWKYTRHPNYFGDSVVWWSYAIFCLAAGYYWQTIGSVVMTFLLVKISGVALLERNLNETKPQYREYIKSTSSFFPWINTKKTSK